MDICIIFLLLIVVSATGELVPDEPQRRLNASLEQADLATALFARNTSSPLAKRSTCRTGYSACDYDASRCCVTGYTCCSTGWCAAPGYVCCGAGACPSNWQCCGAINTCAPIGGECCSGGLYCLPGKHCRLWNGKRVCCPSSGCAGESSNGDLTSSLLATMSTVSATAGLTEISATTTATSSTPNHHRTSSHTSSLSAGAIAGIAVGCVVGVLILAILLFRKKLMACIKPAKPASDVGPGMSPGYVAPSEASGNTGLPGAGPSEMSEETAVYEVGASETTSPPKRLHDVHELDS